MVQDQANVDYDAKMKETINYYVMFGFLSLFVDYLAHVTWNTASERQIKNMRFRLFLKKNLSKLND